MQNQEKFSRTEEEQKRCDVIYDKYREDLLKRLLSNNENYDKTIISLSSAGLALSLTAVKFIVPLDLAHNLWLIKLSWFLFLITLICSITAYLVGNKAISKQMVIAENYYIAGLVSAQTERNPYSKINSILNNVTGLFFIFAISLVIFFVTSNLKGNESMVDKKTTVKKVSFTDSASIPRMQLAPGTEGKAKLSADIPSMQLAPGGKSEAPKSASPVKENSGDAKAGN